LGQKHQFKSFFEGLFNVNPHYYSLLTWPDPNPQSAEKMQAVKTGLQKIKK